MRRVIIGTDADGKAAFVYDGPPQSINHISVPDAAAMVVQNLASFPDHVPPGECAAADIWETDGLPTPGAPDRVDEPRPFILEPPGTGLRIRYQAWGAGLFAPMHATDTLDIDYVISGEVELMLEGDRSVTLNAGDSIVVPGTNHAWRAGPEGVKMLIVMQKMAAGE
jgi:quercetin dioxygenase-like cupin family protein